MRPRSQIGETPATLARKLAEFNSRKGSTVTRYVNKPMKIDSKARNLILFRSQMTKYSDFTQTRNSPVAGVLPSISQNATPNLKKSV